VETIIEEGNLKSRRGQKSSESYRRAEEGRNKDIER